MQTLSIASLVAGVLCLCACCPADRASDDVAHHRSLQAAKPDSDGFYGAFTSFASAAVSGDVEGLARFASPEVEDLMQARFSSKLDREWRLHHVEIVQLTRSSFAGSDLVIVRAVLEDHLAGGSNFYVMHWAKRNDRWQFLDFPFSGSGIVPSDAFANHSMQSIKERYVEKAEPGATDNPDDAQPLREDH